MKQVNQEHEKAFMSSINSYYINQTIYSNILIIHIIRIIVGINAQFSNNALI